MSRPIYEATQKEPITGISKQFYIYYDKDCDGEGTFPNRWFVKVDPPKQDAWSNLNGDVCSNTLTDKEGGGYTTEENFDWFPPMNWQRMCYRNTILSSRDWHQESLAIDLPGCEPYATRTAFAYTTTPWVRVVGNDGRARCERQELKEICSTWPTCPCKSRRDPLLPCKF